MNHIKIKFNSNLKSKSGTLLIKILAFIAFLLGIVAILIYVYPKGNFYYEWLGACLMIAFACFNAGSLLGLLFSIPKILQHKGQEQYIEINTSIEQIADWLTKILIGIGLTQIIIAPSFLLKVSTKIVMGINCNPVCQYSDVTFIIFLIIFYLLIGFILAYFYGKLDFPKRFGNGLFVKSELYTASEENLRKVNLENTKFKETASYLFNNDEIHDSEKQILRKILSVFQKEVLKQMIEDNHKLYRIPKPEDRILKPEEFLDLNHLITIRVAKLIDGDSIHNTSAIELEKKFLGIKLSDII